MLIKKSILSSCGVLTGFALIAASGSDLFLRSERAWALPASPAAKSNSDVKKKKGASAALPALLAQVEKKYADALTLEADFSQVNESSTLGTKKQSQGRLLVRRPNQLRWETLQPERSLLVSDGRRFWYYTPPFEEGEPGQVIEKSSNQIQSQLANALLSGRFSMARDVTFTQIDPTQFSFTPKKGTAGTVQKAWIHIDSKEQLIQKVVLQHEDGNRSEISLSKIQLGNPIDSGVFHFTPPKNTDVIRQ